MNEKAFFNMSYGVYIATTVCDGKFGGHIVNAVMQTTSSPATFCLCSNKNNQTCQYIQKSQKFAVSVLDESVDMKFIGQFGFKSSRDIDKFDGVQYKLGQTGCPIVLDNCLAYIECNVINSIDVGSHILFIGQVVDADEIRKGTPLTYSNYHLVKKGLSPKNAPTYIEQKIEDKKETKTMKKYKCQICGYVYDPAVGDPDSGIAPGTAFEDIPDDWVCPICGVGKDSFAEE